jgi:RHS repeat-associated protein
MALKVVGGDSVDLRYDAAGRLVRKDVNGAVQRYFLWQGQSLLAELNATATGKIAEYSYYPGLDRLHALITGTTPYFAHTDAAGNVIALTDSGVQRSYRFDAWGTQIDGADVKPFSNADRPRFKGALWLGPEVDLYYMRARWYEPRTGRFLSEDPIGLDGGINPYAFAAADPVNRSDPAGLIPCNTGYESQLTWSREDGYEERCVWVGTFVNSRGAELLPGGGIPVGWWWPGALRESLGCRLSGGGGIDCLGGELDAGAPRAPETLPGRRWDFVQGFFTGCPLNKSSIIGGLATDPATGRILGVVGGFVVLNRLTDRDQRRLQAGAAIYMGGGYVYFHGKTYGGMISGTAQCATGEGTFAEMSIS